MKPKPNKSLAMPITGSGGKSDSSYQVQSISDDIQTTGHVKALAVLSAGPIEGLADGLSSLKLDDTPYANRDGSLNFAGVSWQITTGTSDQSAMTAEGFNSIERADTVSQTLLPSQAVIRTGSGDAARVTIRFPEGLIQQTDIGYLAAGIALRIERRLFPDGTWEKVLEQDINKKQSALFEMQFHVPAPASPSTGSTGETPSDAVPETTGRPRWSMRLTRLTPARSNTRVRDKIEWGWVTWITHDQLSYPGVSLLAISASAKGVSGRLPRLAVDVKGRLLRLPVNYDPVARSYEGIWNGRFHARWSNNPAWVLYDLLTDRNWGLGLDDGAINRYDFYALGRYADGMVSDGAGGQEPRFRFDAVITSRESAGQLVARICANLRAVVFWSGGQLRCVFDQPKDAVMRLSNAHVEQGRFVYSTAPRQSWFSHAVVTFDDPSSPRGIGVEAETSALLLARHGFRQREVRLFGCQRRSEARRHARWLLESAEAGHHSISWRAGLDHFADHPVRPGDVIAIYDENRLKGKHIPIRLRLVNAKLETRQHILGRFGTKGNRPDLQLRYETATGWQDTPITVTDHQDDGEEWAVIAPTGNDGWPVPPLGDGVGLIRAVSTKVAPAALYRVVSLREIGRFQLEVDAIHHDPAKYDRIDTASAAVANPATSSTDFSAALPAATGLTSHQLNQGSGRDLYLSWTPPSDPRLAQWQIEASGPDLDQRIIKTGETTAILPDCQAGAWQITVKAVDWLGRIGPAAALAVTVSPDASSPAKPRLGKLIAGYEQIALSWTMPAAHIGDEVEIWEYPSAANSDGVLKETLRGTNWISLGRVAGQTAWFRLRTRLKGGTTSAFTTVISGMALALPDPQDGLNGQDGLDGLNGQDGINGEDGLNGKDGQRGSIITSRQVTAPQWNGVDALAAVAALADGGVVAGDLVTLYQSGASPWSQTRRYDGLAWVKVTSSLSGDQLTEQSVPATRLKLDGTALVADGETGILTIGQLIANQITSGQLTSSGYVEGSSGFRIDLSGRAEFNEATIRGVLIGGRVESATLVSTLSTTPTEAGKPFLTLDTPRKLTYETRQISGNNLIIGPMIVEPDAASVRFGDGRRRVIACDDPHQAVAGNAINPYFTRFWGYQPRLNVTLSMARSGQPWGEIINHGRVRVRVETSSGEKLAESQIYDLSSHSAWRNGRQDASYATILPARLGFSPGSVMTLSRNVEISSDGLQAFTSGLVMELRLGFRYSQSNSQNSGSGIRLKILIDFNNTTQNLNIVNYFYQNISIEGSTIDG